MDGDLADVLRGIEPDMRPRLSGVRGLVHPVAVANGVAQRRFTAADVHDVGRRWRHRDRADRRDGLRVEDRGPYSARIDRLPHTAVDRAEIELVRPSGHTGRRRNSSTAERPEHSPAETRAERIHISGCPPERVMYQPEEAIRERRAGDVERAADLARAKHEVAS